MPSKALHGILSLIYFLLQFISINHFNANEVAFADDFTVTGKLTSIKDYWGKLTGLCPKYHYFPKASKSYLIVKEDKLGEARNVFNDLNVYITIEGKRHLGAVIRSNEYREEYMKDLVNDWNNQLVLLSSISESQPQTVYSAFVSDFKSKLSYFMGAIPGVSQFLYALEETVRKKFIPAITGGHICSNNEPRVLSVPTRYSRLAIPMFYELAETEYESSRKITSELTPLIINQSSQYNINERKAKQLKQNIKGIKESNYRSCLQELIVQMDEKEKQLVKISTEKGLSNWLTMLRITKHGFELSKQEFWDSVRLRYGSEIANLPIFCPCGSKFDIQHSINCKKGGFVKIRQNHLRDLFARIVSEVCKDTEIEPKLLPLPGYEQHGRTTNGSN